MPDALQLDPMHGESHSTGCPPHSDEHEPLRLLLFTDTLGDVSGVCRFILNMGEQAQISGRNLHIATSTRFHIPEAPYIHNFTPRLRKKIPSYENLDLVLPPIVPLLRLATRLRPHVIHVSTPGPVGLAGRLAARFLHVPLVGVYHTDYPAYIDHLFNDAVYTRITVEHMRRFYRRFTTILMRSQEYIDALTLHGVDHQRMKRLTPGIALSSFQPSFRKISNWPAYGLSAESVKVLYTGRLSIEKNLPLLTDFWPHVHRACQSRGICAELVIIGDGPYSAQMQRALANTDAHFLGFKHGDELSQLYASADLFVFPSLTDTLGQVVIESQSSGLPVLVSDQGGPKEIVNDGVTGFVLPGKSSRRWRDACINLITNQSLRQTMGRAAHEHAQQYSIHESFAHFWAIHQAAHDAGAKQAPIHL